MPSVGRAGQVELRTDGVMRSPTAKEYTAGHRMYGDVTATCSGSWTWPPSGQPLQSHVSAELKRVE